MKNIQFLLISFFFFLTFSFGQDLESLRGKLKKQIHDTTRLTILAQIVELEEDGVWQKYNLERKNLAQKNRIKFKSNPILYKKYSFEFAEAIYNEGVDHYDNLNPKKAIDSYRKSLKVFRSIKDEKNYAAPLSGIANIYAFNGNYKRAISLLYKALKIYESRADFENVGDTYLMLADIATMIFDRQAIYLNNKKALKYYHLGKIKNGIYMANCNLSDFFILEKDYEKATFYLEEAEKYHKYSEGREIALIYIHRGSIFQKTKEFDKAISNFEKSIEIGEDLSDLYLICISKWLIGSAYENKNQFIEAEKYTLESYKIAKENDFSAELEKTSKSLMYIYQGKKEWKKAAQFIVIYNDLIFKKNVREIKTTVLQEQYKYKFEKKELIEKAKVEKASFQKNVWIISISFLLLIFGIITFFSFKNTKQKKTIAEQKSNILKQKLLVSQMNPHFIFNSLNAIQNCIFKDDGLTAGTYLAQFADLMRMILDFSRKDSISLDSEVKLLENYLELQQFRFNNKFDYELRIDKDLTASQVEIPPMLAQPFIENAIEHGIFHLQEKGLIEISIFKVKENLRFEIKDNGLGLQKSHEFKPKIKSHQSLATVITQERINALFSTKKSSFELEIHDLCAEKENQTGVKVIFEIPFKLSTTK